MLYFRLAKDLHWPSVEWGLEHISSSEITEWLVLYKLEHEQENSTDGDPLKRRMAAKLKR